MIANPNVKAYRYDPYDQAFTHEGYDHEQMKNNRAGQIELAKTAKTFGIILSTLGRQGNPKIMINLKNLIRKSGKRFFTILLPEIYPDKLNLFEGIDCWIQIACPRLSIDWGLYFDKPLLTPYEAAVALEECKWRENVYPMDFYR
jgi:2-(3-amino-3-carboxypropyl)histidine synthase